MSHLVGALSAFGKSMDCPWLLRRNIEAKQSLERGAEKVSKEPILPDAAACTNVRSLGCGQKGDKIKPSFAKGLWHKIFQCLQAYRRQWQKRPF
ncbi:MAG: hypothetical protein AAFY31_07200 [Pseudomonadota bacterium]